MSTSQYEDVLGRAQRLDAADQLRLILELASHIGKREPRDGNLSCAR